jgi:hypothetical protein
MAGDICTDNPRTMVSPEMSAQDRKWWTDDRYAIYDLNVNSVAAYPQHEEELDLATAGPTYTAKGYAYAGGGRRITRVEISLDRGNCTNISMMVTPRRTKLILVFFFQPGVSPRSNMQKTNTEISRATYSAAR